MKSISIALVVVVVTAICQTKGMKLSALMARTNQQEDFCEICQMFVSTIAKAIDKIFDWLGEEIEVLCADSFAGNSTAVDLCKTKVDAMVTEIREFVGILESPEMICQKIYLC
ncbi:hypothetical protein LOAG_06655 [Loa loa]|uniref:Saposin B-type domain-containing protein n=2 Tax=Loa loa TaxID=7209 RepID=A0A1S0TY81_LOALO|nr:hypothetical protein LOAG_06655 [Loa loa]EFO21833.1 hypothetical protein LOAG_06655 [Loa loa]